MFDQNVWVYYLALLVCGAGAFILKSSNTEYSLIDATSGIKRDKIVWFVTFLMMGYIVFWAAVRNGVVDTAQYIESYRNLSPNTSIKSLFLSKSEKAPLFKSYQVILRKLGFNWQQYLASIAIITGVFTWYGISKYSDDVALSMYLFMTGLYFYWMFNGIRQFLVVAILFASLRLIAEKKLWKFLLIIFILYFLHKTVIIMIPIYFIANMKNWSWGIYACVLATMAVVLLFPNEFVELLNDNYTDTNVTEQFAKDDGVNILRFLVAMVTPTLAFVYKDRLAEFDNPYVNVMINLSMVSAGLYAVGVVTSGVYIGRLPMFVDMYGIIFLPFMIRRVLPKETRGPIFVACIALYFLYFYLQANEGLIYYTTNWFDKMDLGGARL